MRGRYALLSVILIAAGSGLAEVPPADAIFDADTARVHVTERGIEVPMPEIAGLTCAEMSRALSRLDASGYRGRGLLPETHPDFRLFVYEDRLAAAHYTDCTLRAVRLGGGTEVFSTGFGAD